MLRTLNMVAAGNDVPIADGRKQFSRMMLIENIEEQEEFKALFKIDSALLERIVKSIKENGFDESRFNAVEGDLSDKVSGKYNVVVANIVADIIFLIRIIFIYI